VPRYPYLFFVILMSEAKDLGNFQPVA